MIENVNAFAHCILQSVVREGDCAVDATCGNGNDSVFLSALAGKSGRVFAFDIQPEALAMARQRAALLSCPQNIGYICDSHENMLRYVQDGVRAVVFNLGYLPGAGNSIATKAHTTVPALDVSLKLLLPGGFLLVSAYKGHAGAMEEYEAVSAFMQALPKRGYSVAQVRYPNRKSDSPELFIVEKTDLGK